MQKRIIPILLAVIFGFQGESLFSAFLPLLASYFTDNPLLISSLSAIYYLSLGVFGPFWGSLSDSISKRRAFIFIGLTFFSAALFLGANANSIYELLLIRALAGIGAACFTPVAYALVTDYSTAKSRGTNIGLMSGGRSIGWVMGSIIGGVSGIFFGIQGTFLLSSGLALIGASFTIIIRDPPHAADTKHTSLKQVVWAALLNTKSRILSFFAPPDNHYLRRPGMSSLYWAILLRNLGTLAIYSLISILFAEYAGGFPVTILVGLLYFSNTGTQMVFMPVMGHVSDRIGRRRLAIFGFTGSVIVLWIFSLARHPIAFFIGQALTGFSFACLDVSSKAIVTDNTDLTERGEALGFIDTARNIGAVFGIFLLGTLSSIYSISLGIGVMSLFPLIALVLVVKNVPESYFSS
ncbi:MAG: MFS transporter [Candidatus Ranarchaeia archaeon]